MGGPGTSGPPAGDGPEWEAAKDQGHLGCRPPKGEVAYSVKGTVHNS